MNKKVKIIKIDCCGIHPYYGRPTFAALSTEGQLFTWGWNESYQCGLGEEGTEITLGNRKKARDKIENPTLVKSIARNFFITSFSVGGNHCLALADYRKNRGKK